MAKLPRNDDKLRIELFSDVVMGLVMVSMCLRLRLPDRTADGFTAEDLTGFGWQLAATAMSFLVVGIMWVNHRQLAASLVDAPPGLQWLKLNLLFWMSLTPVATSFVGEHPVSAVAVALYAGLFAVTSLSFTVLRVWLARRDPDNPALARVHFGMTHKSLAAGLIYAAGALLAFIHPVAAGACLLVVPLMFLVPQNLGEAG